MKIRKLITTTALLSCLTISTMAVAAGGEKLAVNITPTLGKVNVMHKGAKMAIMRNQDENNTINAEFANTSRKCPPFCVQPAILAPGVETIGEIEVLGYLKKIADGDSSVLVVDSRTSDWVVRGTIPGSVNIPWTKLKDDADPLDIADTLTQNFGAVEKGQTYDYSKAKTLVMFCNGTWCGQSPTNIRKLLALGYPANKLKWYRGGMQDWEALGLTTVK
jgi:rhodanese-related sulfurtransferase